MLIERKLPSKTELNDLLAFEFEYILELINRHECEVCQAIFKTEDIDAVTSNGTFCNPSCAETMGINYCNDCGAWEKAEYQTKEGLVFCSKECLEHFIDSYFTDDQEKAFNTVESLFPTQKITIEFLESQESLTTDEQIAVNIVIEVLRNL